MIENPWKGLSSYREPNDLDSQKYLFCGRKKATRELSMSIKDNLLVTLYGRTGVGKTSLLEAGVFPELRSFGYFPISVRLGTRMAARAGKDGFFPALYITEAIEQSVPRIIRTAATGSDPSSVDYLWEYFATRHFYDGDREIFPVIALDQFEENFISDKTKTWLLMQQLHSLLDDNKIYPEGYHNETVFRIILSIREDDLYRLEDCIDSLHLDDMKFNRYRLVQLTDEEAREVITVPGDQLLPRDHDEHESIVNAIIKIVKDGNDGNINTLILSLVCSLLYGKVKEKGSRSISVKDVHELGNNPLKDFYLSISPKFKKYRYYLEDRLVDADGRRNAVNVEEMNRNCPNWEALTSGSGRILQCSNNKVELVHDMLARAIYEVRLQRHKRKKGKMTRAALLSFLAAIFVCAIFSTVYGIGGKNGSKLQLLEKKGIVTDSCFFSNNHAEKLVWNGSGSLEVSDCASLQHLTVTNSASLINIKNCPELRTIEFQCRSVNTLNISDCPDIRNLNIPEYAGSISTFGSTNISSIVPADNSRYVWLDGVLWDIHLRKAAFISDSKDISKGCCFPFEMRDIPYILYSLKDTLYNTGIWNGRLLFSGDSSRIISSHNIPGPVLDLNRYPSLQYIDNDAFNNGNGAEIHKLILKEGLNIFTVEAFNSLTNLDSVEISGNAQLPEIALNRKIAYITGNSDLYDNDNGIIRKNGEPVWMSSEYDGDVYTEGNAESYSGLTVLARGFYCRISGDGKNVSATMHGILKDKDVAEEVSEKSGIFELSGYRGSTFFKTVSKDDSHAVLLGTDAGRVHIPSGISVLDCSGISAGTEAMVIENPDFNRFTNLPDNIKRNIRLYVPYGHLNIFLNRNGFSEFMSVEESGLMSTLWNNLIYMCHCTFIYISGTTWRTVFVLLGLIAAGILFYILSITSYSKRFRTGKHLILKSITTSIMMVAIFAFSWIAAFWLIINISGNSRPWLSASGAAVFAAAVLFSLHYSILLEFRNLEWGRIFRSTNRKARIHAERISGLLKRLMAMKRKKTVWAAAIALLCITAAVCIFCLSPYRTERRILNTASGLAYSKDSKDKENAIAILTDYLSRDTVRNSHLTGQMYSMLQSLASELDYGFIRSIPSVTVQRGTRLYSEDSSVSIYRGGENSIVLWDEIHDTAYGDIILHKEMKCMDISNDGRLVTAVCGDILSGYEILVYNIMNRMSYSIYCGYSINDICFSPDNVHIAAGCADGFVRIWDTSVDPISCIRKLEMPAYSDIIQVYYSTDGSMLYACRDDGTMSIWSTSDIPDNGFLLKACRINLGK